MKNQYILFLFSLCIISFLGVIWYFYPSGKMNTDPPISSEISSVSTFDTKGNSGTTIPIESVQTGTIDTNTGTQNKTHSEFIFQKPNTEWKSRDITLNDGRTLHYVFGEGNPKEVALTLDEIRANQGKCQNHDNTSDFLNEFCSESSGYVTPEMEYAIKAVLDNPGWRNLLEKCKESLTSDPNNLYSAAISGSLLDINNFILINPISGRKVLDMNKWISMKSWLYNATAQAWNETQGGQVMYTDPTCVDRYIPEILRNLTIAKHLYISPGVPLTSDLLDAKKYHISR